MSPINLEGWQFGPADCDPKPAPVSEGDLYAQVLSVTVTHSLIYIDELRSYLAGTIKHDYQPQRRIRHLVEMLEWLKIDATPLKNLIEDPRRPNVELVMKRIPEWEAEIRSRFKIVGSK